MGLDRIATIIGVKLIIAGSLPTAVVEVVLMIVVSRLLWLRVKIPI